MPNFREGPVPSPSYDDNSNIFSQRTEFTDDVFIYGKLYADINKAKNILNWEPKYSKIETILQSAWDWHKKSI